MLNLQFRRIKPGCEERLRAWFSELNARADEVRETFVDEGVRHERAYILQTSDGPILVWAAELDDPDRANRVFSGSRRPIDVEHERVLKECLGTRIDVAPALDVQLVSPEP